MRQPNPEDRIHNSQVGKELEYWQREYDRRRDPKGDEGKEEIFVAKEGHAGERISGRDCRGDGDQNIDQHIGNRIEESRAQVGVGPDARVI